jgi:hypothetical protein
VAEDIVTRMACVDCLMFAANGDTPEDDTIAEVVANAFGRWFYDGYVVAAGDGEHDVTFSTAPCDVCNSTLFGSRHQVYAIPRPATTDGPAS